MKTYIFDITLHKDFYRGLVAACSDCLDNAIQEASGTLQILKGGTVAKCELVATCENFSFVALEDWPISAGEVVILG